MRPTVGLICLQIVKREIGLFGAKAKRVKAEIKRIPSAVCSRRIAFTLELSDAIAVSCSPSCLVCLFAVLRADVAFAAKAVTRSQVGALQPLTEHCSAHRNASMREYRKVP